MAGAISGVVHALIFTGDLAGGFSLGLSGLIMGTVVTCVIIAVSTFSPVIPALGDCRRRGTECRLSAVA